jgi:hypothetical protein
LDGDADSNNDGLVTGTELGDYLKRQVTEDSRRSQTPQTPMVGKIADPMLNQGDFVFSSPGRPSKVLEVTPSGDDGRVADAPVLTWRGRATTTYRWSVTMGTRDGREVEESAASFEGDAELRITDSTKISTSRPPGRPFTKTKYMGDSIVDSTTSDDEPPTAELFDAPLPTDPATLSGRRTESSYSLFGGVVLSCPAQRQWTVRAP